MPDPHATSRWPSDLRLLILLKLLVDNGTITLGEAQTVWGGPPGAVIAEFARVGI